MKFVRTKQDARSGAQRMTHMSLEKGKSLHRAESRMVNRFFSLPQVVGSVLHVRRVVRSRGLCVHGISLRQRVRITQLSCGAKLDMHVLQLKEVVCACMCAFATP